MLFQNMEIIIKYTVDSPTPYQQARLAPANSIAGIILYHQGALRLRKTS
jgi:hypothetical protein